MLIPGTLGYLTINFASFSERYSLFPFVLTIFVVSENGGFEYYFYEHGYDEYFKYFVDFNL